MGDPRFPRWEPGDEGLPPACPGTDLGPPHIQVVARIQAHPARADLLPRLLAALEPLPVEVMTHSSEPPSPWEGYKLCLSDLPDCSHLLIVQDDVLPVPNFVPALEQIATRITDAPVCLFLSSVPSSAAAKARTALKLHRQRRYLPLGPAPFMPLVAVLWPKRLAEDFLAWGLVNKTTRADDGNAGRWMRERKVGVLVAVPSLVEHDDTVDSVKGARRATGGRDRTRVAALLAEDALAYEW